MMIAIRAMACAVLGSLCMSGAALAAELVIRNDGPASASCHFQAPATSPVAMPDRAVAAGATIHVLPPPGSLIDSVRCGGLTARAMRIGPAGPNGFLRLNGRQTRVLNVALYPFIPSLPNGNFDRLIRHVVARYQAENQDVLLHVVMSESVDIYDPETLAGLLSAGGYDVVELDTLYLGFLAGKGLLAPMRVTGDAPLPAGRAAATHDHVLYGIPSWLCLDFAYADNPALASARNLSDFVKILSRHGRKSRGLSADFSGTTRLPSLYIDAYAQRYGTARLSDAMRMPPDDAVIDALATLVRACDEGPRNVCADGTLTRAPDGEIERAFATGRSMADIGFSEQSFYIALYAPKRAARPTMIPVPWGPHPAPLLYSDAFVTSRASCGSGRCAEDGARFTALMTGIAMKNYIAFSGDLPAGAPPRHLLVATRPFWQQPRVRRDPIYRQAADAVAQGTAFPNALTQATRDRMAREVCLALKARVPVYDCGDTRGPM
ncbi:hypothetical protein AAC691_06895 [Nguyenibacter vanlangensis]|uniref:Lipoprotein n=1 Tax=Nguyenibacter vanlangensis TaxID=1216886 RepID=A0ABZ3D9R5_9PROT